MGPWRLGLVALMLVATEARADPPALGLHGITLGMTPDQASAAAHLPCQTPQYSSDLTCKDMSDGSNYRAMFSAGDPSIALSVQHEFCSREPDAAVLKEVESSLRVPPSRAHADPNGTHIDLDGDNEAMLNPDGGSCPDGGKHFVLLIRSNGLIKMSSDKAVQRAKDALK